MNLLSKQGIDIVGFGPIGRELASRLVSNRGLANKFTVVSISDSSSELFPRNKNEVLKTIVWKDSGKKLSDLKFGTRPFKKSSIFVDLTNSDYSKARESRKRAIDALREGKHFVSASKVALSNYFSEIFSNAKSRKLEIGYGATICGARHAISVAKNIEEGEIESASAVLNASTTLILSMLEEDESLSFERACKKASETGVLERDWSIDLDGIDAAAKTAILANVLFPKSRVTLKTVVTSGIRDEKARELIESGRLSPSYPQEKTRLVSEITKNGASVGAKKVAGDSPLAVKGRFNVVSLNTKNLGEISIRNLGGGVPLTASIVISDLKRIYNLSN